MQKSNENKKEKEVVLHVMIPMTPRHELHKKCCIRLIKLLEKSIKDKKLNISKIFYHINLDDPPRITSLHNNEKDLEVAIIDKFKSEIPGKIEEISTRVFFKINYRKGCFSKAFKQVIESAHKNTVTKNDIYFWLEDDWSFNEKNLEFFLEKLNQFLEIKKHSILPLYSNRISGAPTIFKREKFLVLQRVVASKEYNENSTDPEIAMRQNLGVGNGAQPKDIMVIAVRTTTVNDLPFHDSTRKSRKPRQPRGESQSRKNLFKDEGRTWRIKRKIKKWDKKNKKNNKTWGQ